MGEHLTKTCCGLTLHVRDAAGAARTLGVFYPPNRAHLFPLRWPWLHCWLCCSTKAFSQPGGGAAQFAGGYLVPLSVPILTAASSAA
jgi:hypothetical protein